VYKQWGVRCLGAGESAGHVPRADDSRPRAAPQIERYAQACVGDIRSSLAPQGYQRLRYDSPEARFRRGPSALGRPEHPGIEAMPGRVIGAAQRGFRGIEVG
jgi:hypothetical protein